MCWVPFLLLYVHDHWVQVFFFIFLVKISTAQVFFPLLNRYKYCFIAGFQGQMDLLAMLNVQLRTHLISKLGQSSIPLAVCRVSTGNVSHALVKVQYKLVYMQFAEYRISFNKDLP